MFMLTICDTSFCCRSKILRPISAHTQMLYKHYFRWEVTHLHKQWYSMNFYCGSIEKR